MANILKVKSVGDYERYYGVKSRHPLVSVIDYAALCRPSLPVTQLFRRPHKKDDWRQCP